jgi:hypothetical protein
VEYHNSESGCNTFWRAFILYVVPVSVTSILLCIPKMFEVQVVETHTETGLHLQVAVTDLRFNPDYVLWYVNVTKLLATGEIFKYKLCGCSAGALLPLCGCSAGTLRALCGRSAGALT